MRRQPRRLGVAPPRVGDVADSKDLQQQSKALDKLTDHVEDQQLDSSRIQNPICMFLVNSTLSLYQKEQVRCQYFTPL
jgi:nitric oxide synthase oxygenase domain/subunit